MGIVLLNQENFAKYYAANIRTDDENKFEFYSIIVDPEIVKYINGKIRDFAVDYVFANHKEPLIELK